VFYLPSHLLVALLAAPAIALLEQPAGMPIAAAVIAAVAALRGYRDYPALDRSADDRPARVIAQLTSGLDDRRNIFLADLNWQVQNGLSYYTTWVRREIAWARMPDVLLYLPALVSDNMEIGREIMVSERARRTAIAAYGPLLDIAQDPAIQIAPLPSAAAGLPAGTRYVVTILRPSRDLALDAPAVTGLLRSLAGGRAAPLPTADYAAIGGLVGRAPDFFVSGTRPFRLEQPIGGLPVGVRMESWLASDTIRRMGFGHVIAGRAHTLIVERGVSFVAFDERGRPLRTAYASNIFAPQPRYLVRIQR
jgi:hypothetical protein